MIEIEGLERRFGERVALEGISVRVPERATLAVLGPNGAGKTTLLRMLFGLIRPDAGTLRLFGRTWDEAGPQMLEVVLVAQRQPHRFDLSGGPMT